MSFAIESYDGYADRPGWSCSGNFFRQRSNADAFVAEHNANVLEEHNAAVAKHHEFYLRQEVEHEALVAAGLRDPRPNTRHTAGPVSADLTGPRPVGLLSWYRVVPLTFDDD